MIVYPDEIEYEGVMYSDGRREDGIYKDARGKRLPTSLR